MLWLVGADQVPPTLTQRTLCLVQVGGAAGMYRSSCEMSAFPLRPGRVQPWSALGVDDLPVNTLGQWFT